VAVVTRSQTAALRKEGKLQTLLDSEPEISAVEEESDSVDKLVEADLAQNSFVYSSLTWVCRLCLNWLRRATAITFLSLVCFLDLGVIRWLRQRVSFTR